jgi:hypothetical protein
MHFTRLSFTKNSALLVLLDQVNMYYFADQHQAGGKCSRFLKDLKIYLVPQLVFI